MNQIVINPDSIIVLKDKAGNFAFSQSAEIELQKLLDVEEVIKNAIEYVKDVLNTTMDKEHIKKIVGENIVARKGLYGERYQVNKDTVGEKFVKEVVYTKANSDEITKYYEEKGELPSGVSLKPRSERVSITTHAKQIED